MNLHPLDVNITWTLFLDRDGVINRRLPGDYVKDLTAFTFLDGVLPALAIFSRLFGRIVVVTNQQGIGKGLMTEAQLAEVHRYMLRAIRDSGGRIDAVYHCPALERAGDPCRKPNTGMALQAKTDFPAIDFSRSLMVGDSLSDMEFGAVLGMVNVLVATKAEALEALEAGASSVPIHFRVRNLLQLTELLEPDQE